METKNTQQESPLSGIEKTPNKNQLIWVDLEMTGLDAEQDKIIEIAMIVTDYELKIVAEGPHLVIHQPEEVLSRMDDWNQKHHSASGLIDKVRESKLDIHQAEKEILGFLNSHTQSGQCPLAGNSVHQDRRFIRNYMPQFEQWLHYRIVDVSTIKELVKQWYPEVYKKRPSKDGSHMALQDVRESIEELRYYRTHVFVC